MVSREVTHFWFTAWPDHGVPNSTQSVLDFLLQTRKHFTDMPGPAVVHCRWVSVNLIPRLPLRTQTSLYIPRPSLYTQTSLYIPRPSLHTQTYLTYPDSLVSQDSGVEKGRMQTVIARWHSISFKEDIRLALCNTGLYTCMGVWNVCVCVRMCVYACMHVGLFVCVCGGGEGRGGTYVPCYMYSLVLPTLVLASVGRGCSSVPPLACSSWRRRGRWMC